MSVKIKQYRSSKIGESKFNNFYEKIVSTLSNDLINAGFYAVCGNIFKDNGEGIVKYLGGILKQLHASIPLTNEVADTIKNSTSTRHMTYHHKSGSTVVIFDKTEDFDKKVNGDIKMWGDETAINLAKKSLDKIVGGVFNIEGLH